MALAPTAPPFKKDIALLLTTTGPKAVAVEITDTIAETVERAVGVARGDKAADTVESVEGVGRGVKAAEKVDVAVEVAVDVEVSESGRQPGVFQSIQGQYPPAEDVEQYSEEAQTMSLRQRSVPG
jgi:hypothetical protein